MPAQRTLVEALDEAARADAGFWFVDAKTERFRSYAVLQQEARRIAAALRAAGVRRGDLVALLLPNAEQFLTTLFGASMAGAVPASLYASSTAAERDATQEQTARMLDGARPRAVVTAAPAKGSDPVSDPFGVQSVASCQVLQYETLAAGGAELSETPAPDDIAFVQFTSGSVSTPKGVAITHANLAANIDAINGPAGLATTGSDVAVSWLPLNHDMGLVGMALGALYAARPCVLMPPHVFVKRPVEWLRAIARHRGTISFAPTFGYDLCVRRVKDLEGLDLSSWRVAGCGAEPIHAPVLRAFADTFAPAGFRATTLVPSYGLAEHVLAATLSPLGRPLRIDDVDRDDLLDRRVAAPPRDGRATIEVVSCGRPLPGHDLRIVGEDGRAVADRQVGEIVLAGPSVMRGYYNDEGLTAQTLRDGRLWTGDLGYVSDGELFVCGRAKDVIIVHGRKYHPQDLEWEVDALHGVRRGRVAAFAVNQPGSRDRVVVVVEPNGTAAADALTDAIRTRIADAFGVYVDDVVFVPGGTIGRTTSGKVQRAATKARYERGEFASTTPTL